MTLASHPGATQTSVGEDASRYLSGLLGQPALYRRGRPSRCLQFILHVAEKASAPFSIQVDFGVARLFNLRSPSAIGRLIVPIILDAIKRVARAWALTHVVKKRLERVPPTPTYSNAASAIAMPLCFLIISASRNHQAPRGVFRCLAFTVLGVGRHHALYPEAPAAIAMVSGDKHVVSEGFLNTAIATGEPEVKSLAVSVVTENAKPSNTPSGQINAGCHIE